MIYWMMSKQKCSFLVETTYSKRIHLYVFAGSKQVFDTIKKPSNNTERRLIIDIIAARQAYNHQEISHTSLVALEDKIADGLTKTKAGSSVMKVLTSGKNVLNVKQMIIRN